MVDDDGDGFPAAKDCNDADPAVNPGQSEICGNGVDDNCNLVFDEEDAIGCSKFYGDVDGDGVSHRSPRRAVPRRSPRPRRP